MESTFNSIPKLEPHAHPESNSINIVTTQLHSSTSTSSSSNSEQSLERLQTNLSNHRDQDPVSLNSFQHNSHGFSIDHLSNSAQQQRSFNGFNSSPHPVAGALSNKLSNHHHLDVGSMNGDINQHTAMVPIAAHCSDHNQLQYSLPVTKHQTNSSPPNMALNFSHDLLQTNHHNHAGLQHHHSNNVDVKGPTSNPFELGQGNLMQAAVWKSTMGLNHQFKHPVITDNFLPNADMNSFSNWTHATNLHHQQTSMTHPILEGQHLISYPQHQRPLPMTSQDLVGSSVKGQNPTEHTFMLNSIGHQVSTTSQNSSSNHLSTQPLDNLNIRPHNLDQNASYNLAIADNRFYSAARSDTRSHPDLIKSSFSNDRNTHMPMTVAHSQLSYQNNDQMGIQPTTSQQHQHMAGSSSNSSLPSSKNPSSFKCNTCGQVFPLRTAYQSHLKTHSQDKEPKNKFYCDLCGHGFSQKTSLNRHMKSHTGERPFPCEICSKAFSEKERLKIHMRTHTGEKPFSCNICGKSFSQKSTVKRHQTVHTGEKKFKCDCGKGFANRGNLIAHIKTRGSTHFE